MIDKMCRSLDMPSNGESITCGCFWFGHVLAIVQGMETIDTSIQAEYWKVKAEADEATRVYGVAVKDYRSKKIGDDEFLAARAKHEDHQKRFDVAYDRMYHANE